METPSKAAAPALTPCIGLCKIGHDGYCDGCQRSLAEIAAWSQLDNAQRQAVMRQLALRAKGRS